MSLHFPPYVSLRFRFLIFSPLLLYLHLSRDLRGAQKLFIRVGAVREK